MGHRTIHTPKLRKDWESLTPDPLVIFFFFFAVSQCLLGWGRLRCLAP